MTVQAQIGIKEEKLNEIANVLNTLLADEHYLYIKTRNYHWNVSGQEFSFLHNLFEEQYTEIATNIDDLAERIRALGKTAKGSLKDFVARGRLDDSSHDEVNAHEMLLKLCQDHENVIRSIRKDIETVQDEYGDEGTADFLIGLLADHEKKAWMLRAHLND